MSAGMMMACPTCEVSNPNSAKYCKGCGDRLPAPVQLNGANSSVLLGQPNRKRRREHERWKLSDQSDKLGHATIALFFVGAITLAFNIFNHHKLQEFSKFNSSSHEFSRASAEIWIIYFIGSFFIGLGFLSYRFPLAASLIGMAMYITGQVIQAIINPMSLVYGIILKVVIVMALGKGIHAALGRERERRLQVQFSQDVDPVVPPSTARDDIGNLQHQLDRPQSVPHLKAKLSISTGMEPHIEAPPMAVSAPVPASVPVPPTGAASTNAFTAPLVAEAGLLNGRYEVTDPLDDWEQGSLVHCRDRKTGDQILCVRVRLVREENADLLASIQRVAQLRIPGLITPLRLIRARGYQPRRATTSLADGSIIFVVQDDRTHSILENRAKNGPSASPLAGALRILRPLSEILDACHAAKVPLNGLRLSHIRVDPERRVKLICLSPWIAVGNQDVGAEFETGDADLILDLAHPGAGDPATIIAALAALMLAESSEMHLHVGHNGTQRVVSTAPYAVNQVLNRQLTAKVDTSSQSADAMLDQLQVNYRVQPESYLDQGQMKHLREQLGLDDEQIMDLIRVAVTRARPGIKLFTDQNPTRISPSDLDAALAATNVRKEKDTHDLLMQKFSRGATIGASVMSFLILVVWWLSNDGPQPVLQKSSASTTQVMTRATFTRDQYSWHGFPSRCYNHIPKNSKKVIFYTQITNTSGGDALELIIKDQHGATLNSFSITTHDGNFWAYVEFSVRDLPDVSSVTGQALLNGNFLQEITLPVVDSWFDGIGRLAITLMGVWLVFGVVLWWWKRHFALRSNAGVVERS